MSVFGDFLGGAARSLQGTIDAKMQEQAEAKKAEFYAKLQEKYGMRAEERAEGRRSREDERAYDRTQIDAESRRRAEEIKQQGLLQREMLKGQQRSSDKQFDRDTQFGVADRYAASRTASAAARDKRKQEMDFGFGGNPLLDFANKLTR